jgi:hypothetical protein
MHLFAIDPVRITDFSDKRGLTRHYEPQALHLAGELNRGAIFP